MTKQKIWERRIADWKKSGLSQQTYCQQQGLAISTFYVWLRKIRQTKNHHHATPTAFLPMVIQNRPDRYSTSIAVNANGFSFDCSVVQLAQLITELNRHA